MPHIWFCTFFFLRSSNVLAVSDVQATVKTVGDHILVTNADIKEMTATGCSSILQDPKMYNCAAPPTCCSGFALMGSTETTVQCVPADWTHLPVKCSDVSPKKKVSWKDVGKRMMMANTFIKALGPKSATPHVEPDVNAVVAGAEAMEHIAKDVGAKVDQSNVPSNLPMSSSPEQVTEVGGKNEASANQVIIAEAIVACTASAAPLECCNKECRKQVAQIYSSPGEEVMNNIAVSCATSCMNGCRVSPPKSKGRMEDSKPTSQVHEVRIENKFDCTKSNGNDACKDPDEGDIGMVCCRAEGKKFHGQCRASTSACR